MSDELTLKKCLYDASMEEKEIFLTILCTMANMDSKAIDEEKIFIEDLASELNIEITPRFYSLPPSLCAKYAQKIKSRRLALELIKYMFILSYADKNFSDSEGTLVRSVSEALNIEADKVGSISSWVIDHIIWLEQEAVIFEENANEEDERRQS